MRNFNHFVSARINFLKILGNTIKNILIFRNILIKLGVI